MIVAAISGSAGNGEVSWRFLFTLDLWHKSCGRPSAGQKRALLFAIKSVEVGEGGDTVNALCLFH